MLVLAQGHVFADDGTYRGPAATVDAPDAPEADLVVWWDPASGWLAADVAEPIAFEMDAILDVETVPRGLVSQLGLRRWLFDVTSPGLHVLGRVTADEPTSDEVLVGRVAAAGACDITYERDHGILSCTRLDEGLATQLPLTPTFVPDLGAIARRVLVPGGYVVAGVGPLWEEVDEEPLADDLVPRVVVLRDARGAVAALPSVTVLSQGLRPPVLHLDRDGPGAGSFVPVECPDVVAVRVFYDLPRRVAGDGAWGAAAWRLTGGHDDSPHDHTVSSRALRWVPPHNTAALRPRPGGPPASRLKDGSLIFRGARFAFDDGADHDVLWARVYLADGSVLYRVLLQEKGGRDPFAHVRVFAVQAAPNSTAMVLSAGRDLLLHAMLGMVLEEVDGAGATPRLIATDTIHGRTVRTVMAMHAMACRARLTVPTSDVLDALGERRRLEWQARVRTSALTNAAGSFWRYSQVLGVLPSSGRAAFGVLLARAYPRAPRSTDFMPRRSFAVALGRAQYVDAAPSHGMSIPWAARAAADGVRVGATTAQVACVIMHGALPRQVRTSLHVFLTDTVTRTADEQHLVVADDGRALRTLDVGACVVVAARTQRDVVAVVDCAGRHGCVLSGGSASVRSIKVLLADGTLVFLHPTAETVGSAWRAGAHAVHFRWRRELIPAPLTIPLRGWCEDGRGAWRADGGEIVGEDLVVPPRPVADTLVWREDGTTMDAVPITLPVGTIAAAAREGTTSAPTAALVRILEDGDQEPTPTMLPPPPRLWKVRVDGGEPVLFCANPTVIVGRGPTEWVGAVPVPVAEGDSIAILRDRRRGMQPGNVLTVTPSFVEDVDEGPTATLEAAVHAPRGVHTT